MRVQVIVFKGRLANLILLFKRVIIGSICSFDIFFRDSYQTHYTGPSHIDSEHSIITTPRENITKGHIESYYGIYYTTKKKALTRSLVSACCFWLPSADSNHGQGG